MSFAFELNGNVNDQDMPPRIPQPSHRHGAPSGPWPFLDLDSEIDPTLLANPQRRPTEEQQHCIHNRSTQIGSAIQQIRSGITKVVNRVSPEHCTIHHVNVLEDGTFAKEEDAVVTEDNKTKYWESLQKDMPPEVRLRALFVDNLSGPVLQMLGTRFNIEPFFFSSSLNWIPSRYQEADGEGDHITFTLTFIRCMQNRSTRPPSLATSAASTIPSFQLSDQVIDTGAPMQLGTHVLIPDILAIHMVRSPTLSTIISYHPPHAHRTTTAGTLSTRMLAAGQSVYWNNIFTSTISSDPTFVLLSLMWYPLYAFDESLEVLYIHICWLETKVRTKAHADLTHRLHLLRANLWHYESLLEDFRKSVVFVSETRNPMLEGTSDAVKELMRKESANLLNQIARLEQSRKMQNNRVKNLVNLAFSSVNLEDSTTMRQLTEAAVRDSAAMKQISYLTMFFLPPSLAASLFGMNVREIVPDGALGSVRHYVAFAVPLTLVTICLLIAFPFHKKDPNRHHNGYADPDDYERCSAQTSWSSQWSLALREMGEKFKWRRTKSPRRFDSLPLPL
ncbi:hypothetical protein C8F04DRAFT_1126221 [Mycena alexandri]|uniref:Uncharacterized protein n=1 Tax=Mycena alexandri TaxID=1745969 RepID=A0AAD6SEF7_9AGAR|nr:hypothetical protein C8F04DRAFT_1126221 [Mycena alexandri]